MPRRDATHLPILRGLIATLTLGSAAVAVVVFMRIIGAEGLLWAHVPMIVLFGVLMLWLCQSIWLALTGFFVVAWRDFRRWWKGPAWKPERPEPAFSPDSAKTAIVMPVYNEDPGRVFAGLEAMLDDLDAAGAGDRFDLFILSDTRNPLVWLAEEEAWAKLRSRDRGRDRIFYRRRVRNEGRKSGNIADFLERWGLNYPFFIVLDADSIMTAETLIEMARRIEAQPTVALIQAPPRPVRAETLFARIQAFSASVYGSLPAAGLAAVADGNGNFWGHNAIIRTEAFIDHCRLPHLPGKAPLGGEILSHDFVEAALLRRAGWEIQLADDLEGSYEESPPTIIDFARRDRRWCQGNLQHGRILAADDLHVSSRLYFASGIMAYSSSLVWLVFLLLGGVEIARRELSETVYFTGEVPTPQWPISMTEAAVTLLVVTMAALLMPKVLALGLALADRERCRRLGGAVRLTLSVLLETLYSALLAPVMMMFHSGFVLSVLAGASVGWGAQRRSGAATDLAEVVRAHLPHTIAGLLAGAAILTWVPGMFWWAFPVLLGLVVSIPLSLVSSSVSLGHFTRRLGLFLADEEVSPPPVLVRLAELEGPSPVGEPAQREALLHRVIHDPRFNLRHIRLLRAYGEFPEADRARLTELRDRVEKEGFSALSTDEMLAVLQDPETMEELHLATWPRSAAETAARTSAA